MTMEKNGRREDEMDYHVQPVGIQNQAPTQDIQPHEEMI